MPKLDGNRYNDLILEPWNKNQQEGKNVGS
jgi:hypothetical protein